MLTKTKEDNFKKNLTVDLQNVQYEEAKLNGKNDKIIILENDVFKNNENFEIRPFVGEKGRIVIVLRYTIDDIDFEVVMGEIEDSQDKMNNYREIESKLKKQLQNNSSWINNKEELREILLNKDKYKFNFTIEGMDIIVCKNEKSTIQRTRVRNPEATNLKLEKITTDKEEQDMLASRRENPNFYIFSELEEEERKQKEKIELEKKLKLEKLKETKLNKLSEKLEKKEEIRSIEKDINIQKTWIKRREIILNKSSKEEPEILEHFLIGERIMDILEESGLHDVQKNRQNYKQYLISNYSSEVIENKESLLEEYVDLKEKNIVNTIKSFLTNMIYLTDKKISKLEDGSDEVIRYKKYREEINNHNNFLNLVLMGDGRELIAYNFNYINFNKYKEYVHAYARTFLKTEEEQKDLNEILIYIDLKEKSLNELKPENDQKTEDFIKNRQKRTYEYRNYSGVKQLYNFLTFSSTKSENQEEEDQILSKVVSPLERDIVRKNAESIREYSRYAVLSNISTYDIEELIKHDLDKQILRDNIIIPYDIEKRYTIDAEKEINESKSELPRTEKRIEELEQRKDLIIDEIIQMEKDLSELDREIRRSKNSIENKEKER